MNTENHNSTCYKRMDAESLLEDAFNAIADDRKNAVLADIINRGDLDVIIRGNAWQTMNSLQYGYHYYEKDKHPSHTIIIYRSTRRIMLGAMIHELIHAWQFEVKHDYIDHADMKAPEAMSQDAYSTNAIEVEASNYERLASAFLRKEKLGSDYTPTISMIRESLIKVEEKIEENRLKKASDLLLESNSTIAKCESRECDMTMSQIAKVVSMRSRYLDDMTLLADAYSKKRR
jgi:hypothetical protein